MNKNIPSYQSWKLANNGLSFDRYKDQFGVKEYQCFYLDPEYKLAHADDAEVLFESDDLSDCCGFVYDLFRKEGRDVAVFQERSQGYREIYKNTNRHSKRGKNGKFVK